MLEQQACLWNVGVHFVYNLPSFNLFLLYLFISKKRWCLLTLSPLDQTVLRTSGSTFFIQANTRAWRCTTVQSVTMPPTRPWSSAITWRKITLILRIQTWPTCMQVKIIFQFLLEELCLTKIMKECTTVFDKWAFPLDKENLVDWWMEGLKGWTYLCLWPVPALNIHKICTKNAHQD